METKTANYPIVDFKNFYKFEDSENNETNNLPAQMFEEQRRNILQNIELNNSKESVFLTMKNPITTEKAFQWLGGLLGTFPPMAIFWLFFVDKGPKPEGWIVPLLIFVNIVCGFVGYHLGRLIGKMVAETEKWNWFMMLLVLPFIGIFWGIITGGAGGFFLFIIGAFFGAIIAAMVGSVAITTFTIFHRLLKEGDYIELGHFLPLAIGIVTSICAFILGLSNR